MNSRLANHTTYFTKIFDGETKKNRMKFEGMQGADYIESRYINEAAYMTTENDVEHRQLGRATMRLIKEMKNKQAMIVMKVKIN